MVNDQRDVQFFNMHLF